MFWGNIAFSQVLTGYDRADHDQVGKSVAVASDPPLINEVKKPAKEETKAKNSLDSTFSKEAKNEPVDLQADNLTHDDQNQMIEASGNVMLVQAGRILRADKITYDLSKDTVVASGHVVLNEENGDIHYAEEVQFNDQLKTGFVKGLKTFLIDGSRFTAKDGARNNGVETVMTDASYTPCEECKEDPDRAPVWAIRASKVTHDSEDHEVSYNNAWFELWGVPVAYTPYFTHPDGTIKQQSGFLTPSAGYKSELGAFVSTSYYWAIAPDKDATIGVTAMTEEVPLGTAEYRQRWGNASVELAGSGTYSTRTRDELGVNVKQEEELRGHLFGEGLWDINEKWRTGVNLELASDDQYLRQYDLSSEDILENEIYAERFSGRNYTVARALAFQDLRVRDTPVDQPDVVPEILTSFVGEPGSVPVLGGRWQVDGSFLGLRREGDDQDLNRLGGKVSWQRRFVSDLGLVTSVDGNIRGELYNVRDRDRATPGSGLDKQTTETRVFPQAHIQSSYPVARGFKKFQAVVEPIVSLTAAPNIDISEDIPNEDSQDVQIDASNLFEANRFPGLDRVEDRSRVTYGLRTGVYGYEGSHADIFVGQSYRLDEDDNPFPEGSGLNNQESDVVGQLSGRYKESYNLNYRFQLASETLAAQRHEVDASATWERFHVNSRYLFAKGLAGTDIDESREQIQGSASYNVTKAWRVGGGATQDLGSNSGLRTAYGTIDYQGQCVSLGLTGQRNLTDDSSGDSDTEIVFRIGLKNLGEFEASGLRVDSSEE
ncbi:MAG: LPS-assembly protein LptD [Micavibrio sp.]|nr:MAG: LPS-assembly protein LptD [Micavibrio sp.]